MKAICRPSKKALCKTHLRIEWIWDPYYGWCVSYCTFVYPPCKLTNDYLIQTQIACSKNTKIMRAWDVIFSYSLFKTWLAVYCLNIPANHEKKFCVHHKFPYAVILLVAALTVRNKTWNKVTAGIGDLLCKGLSFSSECGPQIYKKSASI